MGSTRYTSLQIYQDPVESFDHAPMPTMHNTSHPSLHSNSFVKKSPLRSTKNTTSRSNPVLNPPQTGTVKRSPLKSGQQQSSSPLRPQYNSTLNSISMPPPGTSHYNTDSLQKKQPLMSKFKPQRPQNPPLFGSVKHLDKENYIQPEYYQPPQPVYDGFQAGQFSLEGLYPQQAPKKRTLLEAAPIYETRAAKKPKVEEVVVEPEETFEDMEIPAPDSFPPLHDDGGKPSYSYAQMIGMAILRASNRRLTLAQIYKWISDNFSFYSATSETGWQNSIRHNLSLNKAFIKQTRPKNDTGKGNYWAIEPGMEHTFLNLKEKSAKKTGPNENVAMMATNLAPVNEFDMSRSSFRQLPASLSSQELPQPKYTLDDQLPTNQELSSDATIPASDAFEEVQDRAPTSPEIRSSPPAMHSSPPVSRHNTQRHDTPPPVPPFASSSRTKSHKRKFASMDDSGYISSLDSSAVRPSQLGRFLPSNDERPRLKRGRAEEEIARLRASSYDSPAKGRSLSYGMPSSSPFHQDTRNKSKQMLPPLTPALKLKAPDRPPPSISPNTNLQLHRDRVREMVGSPLRGMKCIDEGLPPWDENFTADPSHDFVDYAPGLGLFLIPGDGSPEKRSAKRPRLDRSKSANILSEVTNTGGNKGKINAGTLSVSSLTSNLEPSFFTSPLKGLGFLGSPTKFLGVNQSPLEFGSPFDTSNFELPVEEDYSGLEFLTEEMNEYGGLDITQGFQKIGGGQSSRSTPQVPQPARQPLGRSYTSQL
ncbi:hypothetical protein BJ878DRAFT_91911 [Calycina marina]|uniref:Fork-head domain-containing protein n=1 Tax=Calycina marina TaxID=1763456 RepID=A0A9P7ZD14_9HELO|nr:hypothetical protein BJ878DRAFT_91911 [Calycina marina]